MENRDGREAPDLSQGGIISVLLGKGGELPTDYALHPLVFPVEAWRLQAHQVDGALPGNVKVVVFGPGERLERNVFTGLHDVLRKRRLFYINRESSAAVADALKELLPKRAQPLVDAGTPSEIIAARSGAKPAAHGSIKEFVEKHLPTVLLADPVMPTAEVGRRLFRIAQAEGLTTTIGSLQQSVRMAKRDGRLGTRPTSAVPERMRVLQRIDAAIEELQACRVYIETMEKRADTLEAKLAKAKEVFTAFGPDMFGE